MSDKLGYFIDIEIFIKYTFEYEDVFYSEKEQSDEGKLFSNTTKKIGEHIKNSHLKKIQLIYINIFLRLVAIEQQKKKILKV